MRIKNILRYYGIPSALAVTTLALVGLGLCDKSRPETLEQRAIIQGFQAEEDSRKASILESDAPSQIDYSTNSLPLESTSTNTSPQKIKTNPEPTKREVIAICQTYQLPELTNQNPLAQEKTNAAQVSVPGKINNLISDDFFQDSNYLTETQIRSLLKSKGSCLARVGAEKFIAQASNDYQINPLILLGRLQTEQSLVERKRVTKKQLRYATGYGVFDNGRKLPSSGLRAQIRHAAEGLREHFDAFYGQRVRIDYGKRTVTPKNAATYASLRYTPHTHGATLNARVVKGYEYEATNKFKKNKETYAQAPSEISVD